MVDKTTVKTDLIRVFIGFDPREEVALHVLSRSIWERSSLPVSITPIRLSQLEGVFTRERDPLQSSEFSFSRFLTPGFAATRAGRCLPIATCSPSRTSLDCGRSETSATP